MPRQPKQISMDAAFKSLIREMDIPKQKDLDKLNAKIDRLEKLLKQTVNASQSPKSRTKATPAKKSAGGKRDNSATAVVLAKIQRSKKGVDVEGLKSKTGFDDKKLRNIVHRLYKLEKIKRVGRGKYVGA